MGIRSALLSLFIIGILAPVAPAATNLTVDLGWQGVFRARRWGPIFITVSDSTPRNAQIEVYTGHDEMHGMRVYQTVPLNSTPTTYVIYVPMQNWGPELSVVVRTAGRRLAYWNLMESSAQQHFEPVEQLIGITGRQGAERLIELQFGSTEVKTPWVSPLHLPAVATGYDGFNALLLNQPDLSRISAEQQEAMVDWVRAGGHLICWMGEEPPPGSSPLLDALPAMVGENIAVRLSDGALDAAGLAERFRTLKGRALMAHPRAKEIPLLSDSASAWQRSLGLGSITLLPIDVSTLMFDTPQLARSFWTPLLAGVAQLEKPVPAARSNTASPPPSVQNFAPQRMAEASDKAMNLLGDVPGAGDFGFSYVALVMLGMMLLVGPIDWIVLKRLGRQPWTWMTTSGWIALITLGAVYIGIFFKSGDLHYRTLRLIDQADTLSVAAVEMAGVYSPRTRQYTLTVDPNGWWEPLAAGSNYSSRNRTLTDLRFHQDYQGNHPDPMLINVWNLRFLRSERITPGAPLLQATLQRVTRQERDFLVGSISNVSSVTLKGLCYRLANGRGIISSEKLAPGETLSVDAPISKDRRPDPNDRTSAYRYVRPPPVGPEVIFDLAIDRSLQIERVLDRGEPYVCLYAEVDAPSVYPTLSPAPANEKHQHYVRAMLPLEANTP